MTNKKTRFSFAFIGGITMIIKCANLLINRGHTITWILPRNKELLEWAEINDITVFHSQEEILACQEPIDYLFSIANDLILKESIIKIPKYNAINLHYAQLPKYAGVFSNAWAILNSEKYSGITWHEIITAIDSGNIVAQKEFCIPNSANAYDLNLIARKIAFDTFKNDLVPKIEKMKLKSIPQNLEFRTYNSLYMRPPGNGILSWGNTAAELDLLVRALNRGPIENSFELARFQFGDSFLIVNKIEIVNIHPINKPGVIYSIDLSGITIGTSTCPIKLSKLIYPNGQKIEAFEWAKINNLSVGDKLSVLSNAYLKKVKILFEKISKNENYCKKAWIEAIGTENKINWNTISQKTIVSSSRLDYSIENIPNFVFILAGFLISIGNTKSEATIIVDNYQAKKTLQKLNVFCNYFLPLSIKLHFNQSLVFFLTQIRDKLVENFERGVHGKDMIHRRKISASAPINIAFEICESLTSDTEIRAPLVLRCELNTSRFQLLSFPNSENRGLNKIQLMTIQNQIIENCKFIFHNPGKTVRTILNHNSIQ